MTVRGWSSGTVRAAWASGRPRVGMGALLETGLWLGTAVLMLYGTSRWKATETELRHHTRAALERNASHRPLPVAVDEDAVDRVYAAAEQAVDRGFLGAGAEEPEDDGARPPAYQPIVAAPRLRLELKGVVGRGGDWSAVIAGVPGYAGAILLQAGDTVAGMRVRRVARDTAVVAAPDTTMVLTVRAGLP